MENAIGGKWGMVMFYFRLVSHHHDYISCGAGVEIGKVRIGLLLSAWVLDGRTACQDDDCQLLVTQVMLYVPVVR